MTKNEFLEQLQRALGSRVSSSVVNENLSYYEEYIATQVRAGRSEESIIESLGDPRLLARSIADAEKRAGAELTDEADEDVYEKDDNLMHRSYRLPGWLILIGVLLIIILVLSLAFSVIKVLLPVIIPIAIIVYFLRILQIK